MDAKQFLAFQLEDAGFQLSKCFEGISEEAVELKINDVGMTATEICQHLGDAYQAFLMTLAGEKYEWGSYKLADASMPAAWGLVSALREQAVAATLASNSAEVWKMANAYILAHDYYHVGQICLARARTEPDFDPYCIYRL